ncbi:MAG TPA: ABC transporter ATP-binding protein/permease [Firmicutes bacterium]|nr:ABC transporter ATP-binding protein/permease [Bacillota bacterium]
MLRLTDIRKNYKVAGEDVPALKGVSVNFRANEFVSILGPSGCGKTTLLNIIGGLDKYTSGDLVINGRSTKSFGDREWDVYRNHRIGFVFQSYNLIPHQTVLGNVELALTIAGVSKAERRARAKAVLEKVGLGEHLNKRPNQLSGGQCQRVAIARALVNDPEILLADEPTGALDTKTSVQIMNLMKEIAGERLVIMVTHNPELAQQYSTRIISLLDGQMIYDTDPYSDEEEEAECRARAEKEAAEAAADGGKKKRKERAKMGFATAFALSGRNLIAKKGRTIMVGIAGSIGIIGVAIVLAFSSGIQGYIASMQNDMLSGYPLYVSQNAVDYSQLLSLTMNMLEDEDKSYYESNKIYLNHMVETLTQLGGTQITNNITQDYIDYVEKMPEEYYEAIRYSYGINFANNIYTDYVYDEEGALDADGNPIENGTISVTGIRAIYASVLGEIEEYASYASMISSIGTFSELPDSEDYIMSQYDLLYGSYPEQGDKNSLVLVLNSDSELTDLMLAQFGYVSAREFVNYAFSYVGEENGEYNEFYQPDKPHMEDPYDYSDFVGENAKKFYWYPNDVVYDKNNAGLTASYTYNAYADDFTEEEKSQAVELNVACILRPKDDVMYGSLSSGLYYTKALSEYVHEIETNPDTMSQVVKDANAATDSEGNLLDESDRYISNVTYKYYYYYDAEDDTTGDIKRNIKREVEEGFGSYASSSAASSGLSMISSMYSREEFIQMVNASIDQFLTESGLDPNDYQYRFSTLMNYLTSMIYGTSDKVVYLSELGGLTLPSRITFYISDFDSKDDVTAYLDEWNDGKDEVDQITYTDTVGVIMEMVGMLITMITVALIVFTSIALVVSTVMIGIITVVSVVERIKEIGVIRAMGGRKRDVKNLFMAETFIIGLLAGLIGIVVTYILSVIANIIIGTITGIGTLAALPAWQAVIMVALSVLLTLISGLIPAAKAAKQDPVVALRTE